LGYLKCSLNLLWW